MTPCYAARIVKSNPGQYLASKTLRKTETLARSSRDSLGSNLNRPLREAPENLIEQRDALLNFSNSDPHPSIDVAGFKNRHVKLELIVRLITECTSRIEIPTGSAPYKTSRAKLARQHGFERTGRYGPVLK